MFAIDSDSHNRNRELGMGNCLKMLRFLTIRFLRRFRLKCRIRSPRCEMLYDSPMNREEMRRSSSFQKSHVVAHLVSGDCSFVDLFHGCPTKRTLRATPGNDWFLIGVRRELLPP